MSYIVKGNILGFEDTLNIEIYEVDELFSTLRSSTGDDISFTLVNPFLLREYAFDLPLDMKNLLEINDASNISVYNILLIQKPLEKSTINFLAPIIVNNDNKKVAQIVLEPKKYPDFGMVETIESFKSEN